MKNRCMNNSERSLEIPPGLVMNPSANLYHKGDCLVRTTKAGNVVMCASVREAYEYAGIEVTEHRLPE